MTDVLDKYNKNRNRKTGMIAVRLSGRVSDWIKRNRLSPTMIFDDAIAQLMSKAEENSEDKIEDNNKSKEAK